MVSHMSIVRKVVTEETALDTGFKIFGEYGGDTDGDTGESPLVSSKSQSVICCAPWRFKLSFGKERKGRMI